MSFFLEFIAKYSIIIVNIYRKMGQVYIAFDYSNRKRKYDNI